MEKITAKNNNLSGVFSSFPSAFKENIEFRVTAGKVGVEEGTQT